ncbi:MAG: peptidyl-prolyl cis-trans isomerase [Bacteroidia bacterium]|nr:peptidyl-prolyl cis-trans isomerase [Bacteroidia bacterium]
MNKIKLLLLFFFFISITFSQKQTVDSLVKSKAKKEIESLRLRVIKGEKMEDIARAYSEDKASALKGGLILDVKKGLTDPEFEKVAFSLKQGQILKVFETQFGYHFIQLVQRRGDLLDLRHVLIELKLKK